MRIALLLPLVAGLGCAGIPSPWTGDLDGAAAAARAQRKPLLVLSIVGDLRKRC